MKIQFMPAIALAALVWPVITQAKWKTIDPDLDIDEVVEMIPVDTIPAGPRKDSLVAINAARKAHQDSVNLYAMPRLLSQTGFYTNMAAKTVTAEAQYYEVNSALWSDGAHKDRWLILPTGSKILFNEKSDYWDYPNGATFVKLFRHDVVPTDTTTRIWWETRVLINKETPTGADSWRGFTYKWITDGSEAHLVPYSAEDTMLNVTFEEFPKGKGQPGHFKKWHFPNRDECMNCHRNENQTEVHGRSVLGFFTAQINRTNKANPTVNQIADFFAKGLLAWENKGTSKPTMGEINAFPKWYAITDSTASLNQRARAYIAANCSGCHGDRGVQNHVVATTDINYDFWADTIPRFAFGNYQTTWNFDVEGSRLVYPGHPELSSILIRQKARRSWDSEYQAWLQDSSDFKPEAPKVRFNALGTQMPPLATYIEDTVATQVIARWITLYDTLAINAMAPIARQALPARMAAPIFRGRNLIVPSEWMGKVSLLRLDGREIRLQRAGANQYAIPASVRSGIYLIRIGNRSFTQYIL